MIKVKFSSYSKVLKKSFKNIEIHKSLEDANIRAMALNWNIESVEVLK